MATKYGWAEIYSGKAVPAFGLHPFYWGGWYVVLLLVCLLVGLVVGWVGGWFAGCLIGLLGDVLIWY